MFRVAGLYIVGAWLAMQVADLFFPAWNIPDAALRYLLVAAIVGFPIALMFGWLYDVTPEGIRRTRPAAGAEDLSLKRIDFVVLFALAGVAVIVLYGSIEKVREVTTEAVIASEKPENSVAVLPFDNLDGISDTEYFSDGVTDEILHRLASYDNIRVMGRVSSFSFKDSDTPIARISDILNVRYLLRGSVRRDGNTVRVTANLIDESGFQLWSETFDRELVNIFSIQSDIAGAVAQNLVAEILPRGNRPGTTTTSTEAYQQYLIGRDHFNKRVTLLVLLTNGAALLTIERRRGLLARLAAAPLSRVDVVLAKLLGKLALGALQIGFALVVGAVLFDVRWATGVGGALAALGLLGSWALFAAASGILVGNLARTEGEAVGIGVVVANLLAALGGCWWPIDVTPAWMQEVAGFLPTGWAMRGLHELASFGKPASAVLGEAALLLAGALAVTVAAVRTFRYR